MMNEEKLNKHDILHKPDLDYEKNYDTVNTYKENEETESSSESSVIDELIDSINGIHQLFPLFPSNMQEIINMPLSIIEQMIGEFDEPKKTITVEEALNIVPIVVEDKEEQEFPTGPFREDPEPFEIIVSNNNKTDVIEDQYNYDMISIINDYLNKLNDVTMKYVNSLAPSLKTVSNDMFLKILNDYTGSTENVSANYKHLSDLIIKSQVGRNLKTQFYSKMFNVDKTITHIRACKIVVEQQKRYYEAQYDNGTSYHTAINNRLLENSRLIYDVKYKENFLNLYKYLNSSVIVLNECVQMLINEAQAKIILLEKEGNDLW